MSIPAFNKSWDGAQDLFSFYKRKVKSFTKEKFKGENYGKEEKDRTLVIGDDDICSYI